LLYPRLMLNLDSGLWSVRGMSRRLLKFSGGSVAVIPRVEGTLALHKCSEYRRSYQ
jgi:hypothetical protein